MGYANDVCEMLDVYQVPPMNTYTNTLGDLPIAREIARMKPLFENVSNEKKGDIDPDMELVLELIGAKANRDSKQQLTASVDELTADCSN